jgi:uncharacterized membrane protein
MSWPVTAPAPANAVEATRARNDAVDLLRGLVMVLMALDHVRDFFTNHPGAPGADFVDAGAALFLTRWVTHFCAPVFVFLAGTGARLALARGKSRGELARFLVSRGLWLLVVEVTLVRWGWFFDVSYHFSVLQVIWVLGLSMIALAGLIFLPTPALAAFALLLCAGHNLLDGIHASALGRWGWLWNLVHERGLLMLTSTPLPAGRALLVIYPLVPWPGVMVAGFLFGGWLGRSVDERRRLFVRVGLGLTLAFVALRALNGYGDPRPWTAQASPVATLFSFLACNKYPPSLAYLLMTLGPAIALLGLIDGAAPRWARPLVTFGRVPFFYYVTHVPLLHGFAVLLGAVLLGSAGASAFIHKVALPSDVSARFGFSLPIVYLMWALVVLALYPLCRWFAGVKARSRARWLSYL